MKSLRDHYSREYLSGFKLGRYSTVMDTLLWIMGLREPKTKVGKRVKGNYSLLYEKYRYDIISCKNPYEFTKKVIVWEDVSFSNPVLMKFVSTGIKVPKQYSDSNEHEKHRTVVTEWHFLAAIALAKRMTGDMRKFLVDRHNQVGLHIRFSDLCYCDPYLKRAFISSRHKSSKKCIRVKKEKCPSCSSKDFTKEVFKETKKGTAYKNICSSCGTKWVPLFL